MDFRLVFVGILVFGVIIWLLLRNANTTARERNRLLHGSKSGYQSVYQDEMDRQQARHDFRERERTERENIRWAKDIHREMSPEGKSYIHKDTLPKDPFKPFGTGGRGRKRKPGNPYDLEF